MLRNGLRKQLPFQRRAGRLQEAAVRRVAICWLAHLAGPDSDHHLGSAGPMGRAWQPRRRKGVDHPAQAGQAGGEDHIMERNLGNPLISPRGLAADHCISRLSLQQFLPRDK